MSTPTAQHWSTNPLVQKRKCVIWILQKNRSTCSAAPIRWAKDSRALRWRLYVLAAARRLPSSSGSSRRAENWLHLTEPADRRCETGATLCCNLQLGQLEPSQKPEDLATLLLWLQANKPFLRCRFMFVPTLKFLLWMSKKSEFAKAFAGWDAKKRWNICLSRAWTFNAKNEEIWPIIPQRWAVGSRQATSGNHWAI